MLGVIHEILAIDIRKLLCLSIKVFWDHILEYCVPIWRPYYQKDIELFEGVQCHATKLIDGERNLHYKEHIKN